MNHREAALIRQNDHTVNDTNLCPCCGKPYVRDYQDFIGIFIGFTLVSFKILDVLK